MVDIRKTFSLESQRKLDSPERIATDPETWVNKRIYKREGGVYYIAEGKPTAWNRVAWVTEEMMLAADALERQNTELQDTDAMPLTLLEQSELGLLSEPEVTSDPTGGQPVVEVGDEDLRGLIPSSEEVDEFETSNS